MPRSDQRRLPPAERRRLIELAAARLFAQRGYSATTVEDIVRAAGVTKPMLYRHFDSKRELCIALLERYRDELVGAPLARLPQTAADPRQALRSMLEAWLTHIEEHEDETRLLFTPISGDDEVERVQRSLHARQRATHLALLSELAPELSPTEAQVLGQAISASLAAVALWWLDHREHPLEVPLRALLRITEGALTGAPPPPQGG